MLIRFSVENWMSFQAKATFSLIASRERQHGERVPKIGKLKLGFCLLRLCMEGMHLGKPIFLKLYILQKD
jgi:hypothetical protein